jgi:hypothetical protein
LIVEDAASEHLYDFWIKDDLVSSIKWKLVMLGISDFILFHKIEP